MWWSSTLASISNSVTAITKYLTTSKEKQSESEVIKEKKSLKKAVDIAEQMFKIAFKYIDVFNKKDKNKFEELHEDFLENN